MIELTSITKVSELQTQSPAMAAALMGTGIFREGDDPDVTIDDLCLGYGLNPVVILRMLMKAGEGEMPSGIDVSELDGMTLTQIVENIESLHHVYLRAIMPMISQSLDRVVNAHGEHDIRLVSVKQLFDKLAADLETHMLHEEEALFPMCRDMEIEGKIKPTRCGDAVGGPIACMENDHEQAKIDLEQLCELTDNFAVPGFACATYRKLLEQLVDFNQNMAVHIHKEDKVLFPGAIKAQAALRESASS
jgi:regulator of cell morphogenesis and NO signaling